MANNQNESTMKFKVDISDLKANIQQAQRTIKVANSEFKAASATMGDWGKSSDGLSAKLKQLDTVMNAQKTVLASLEDQYEIVANEQGENSKAAQDLMVKINNQKAAIGKTESQMQTYTQKLNEIEDANKQAETAMGKLTDQIQDQETQLSSLKSEYQKVALEQGKNSDEAKRLEGEISSLNSELQGNKQKLKDAAYASDDLGDSLQDASDSAEDAGGGFTVLKGALADLLSQGIQMVITGLKDLATESDSASKQFQASTGASTESMKKYNKVMQEIYKNNFGDSLDDIAQSMAEIKQQTNEIDPSKLKEMTENAITLRDTFGFEVKESMRAVNMLMNQFGISSEEAFNLVAQGAQNGLDKNGDLLDTINEYAPYYKRMGASSEDFFNSLVNGAKSGTFSVDKLGDAYKEFNIRVQDTATTTTEGFEALGFNADEMRAKFAKGGETAKKATQELLIAFKKMDDPVKKNLTGVNLWGTMYEDLGEQGVMALMDLSGSASKTAETMEGITKIKYSDVGNQFKELGRTMKTEILVPFAQELLPVLKDGINWTKENLDTIVPVLKTVATATAAAFAVKALLAFKTGIVDLGTAMVTLGAKNIPLLSSAFSKLGAFLVANPWVILATAIAGVGIALFGLSQKEDENTKKAKESAEAAREQKKAYDETKKAREEALDQAVSEIDYTKSLKDELMTLVDANGKVKSGYEGRVNFILGQLNSAYGTEMTAVDGVIGKYQEQMATIDQLIEKKRASAIIEGGMEAYTEALQNETKAWVDAGKANDAYAEKLKLWDETEKWMREQNRTQAQIDLAEKAFMNQEEVQSLEKAANDKAAIAQGYTDTIANQEYLQKLSASGTAEDLAKINASVGASYEDKGKRVKLSLEQQLRVEQGKLVEQRQLYKETGEEMYKDQIDATEKRIMQLNADLNAQTSTVETKTPQVATAWEIMGKSGVSGLKKNSTEYKNAALEQTALAKRGVNAGTPDTSKAWNYLASQGLAEYKNNQWQYTPAGEDAVRGVEIGLENRQGTVWERMNTIGLGMIGSLRNAIESHSPSRKAMDIGEDWDDGLVLGLKKGMDDVTDAVEFPMDGLKKSVSNVKINRTTNAVVGNSNIGVPQTGGSNVYFYQTNNSPKALNRLDVYRQTNTLLFSAKVGLKK